MKRNIQRNAEVAEGGGAAAVAEPTNLSEINPADIQAMLDSSVPAKKEEVVVEGKKEEGAEGKKEEETLKADEKKVEGEKKEEAKPADKKEEGAKKEGEEGSEEGTEFEDTLKAPELSEEAQSETWNDVGKAFGVEITETDPEKAFEELKTKIDEQKKSEYERGKKEAEAIDPDKYGVEERRVLSALKGGKKLADIVNVTTPFNETLALDSKDLMKLYFTNTLKQDEAKAEETYATMEANGTLAVEEAKVRNMLSTAKENAVNNIIKEGEDAFKAEQKRIEDMRMKENAAFGETLSKTKEFMGAKVDDNYREVIKRNWEAGKYRKIMESDPEAAVKFAMFIESGQQRIEKLKADAKRDGKMEVLKKKSNTGMEESGSRGKAPVISDSGKDQPFDPESISKQLNEARGVQFGQRK